MNCTKYIKVPFFKHLFYEYYMYIDSKDYKADDILLGKNIHASILSEWYNPAYNYWLINVRIRKNEKEAFEDAMEQLARKQLISGNTDYLDRADEICRTLLKQAERL